MAEEPNTSEESSYQELYRMWEEANWSAAALDFSIDARDWTGAVTPVQRRAALWSCSLLLIAQEAGVRTLIPVLEAAPEHSQRTFLTTEIVDEARHHVFFDRFLREVVGRGHDEQATLEAARTHATPGLRQLLEELDRLGDALRRKPKERDVLARTIALHYLVVEGMFVIPAEHFLGRYPVKLGILPSFARGVAAAARDEARHVAFGVKFLRALVASSNDCRAAVIDALDRVLRSAMATFVPPERDRAYARSLSFGLEEFSAFGLQFLEEKLRILGIDRSELRMLAYQNAASHDERARQLWVLIDAGLLGGDERRELELAPEAFDILFEGMARLVDLDVARSLGGPIEWDFNDAEPWHIVVIDGRAEAKLGRAGNPALRLETSSHAFARIAVGRTDARWALLKRSLKVHGHLAARAKLPKLFK